MLSRRHHGCRGTEISREVYRIAVKGWLDHGSSWRVAGAVGGAEVIADAAVLSEIQASWRGVEMLRHRIQLAIQGSVLEGAILALHADDAAHNLPFVHACAVLNDALEQLRDERRFKCNGKRPTLGILLSASEDKLPWKHFTTKLQPGYLVDSNRNISRDRTLVDDPQHVVTVEILDDFRNVIMREHVLAYPFCSYPGGGTGDLSLATTILFPEKSRTIAFRRSGSLIHEITVAKAPPEVRLLWNPDDRVDGRQVISWHAESQEARTLYSTVLYSHTNGRSWQPLSLSLCAEEIELDFGQLPGGCCKVKVLVTDGVNTSAAESPTFRVLAKGCRAMILAPPDGARASSADLVWFHGQGFYFEDQRAELDNLSWASSLDGELGRGAVIGFRLSPGDHEITLTAGTRECQGIAKCTINVHNPRKDADKSDENIPC